MSCRSLKLKYEKGVKNKKKKIKEEEDDDADDGCGGDGCDANRESGEERGQTKMA